MLSMMSPEISSEFWMGLSVDVQPERPGLGRSGGDEDGEQADQGEDGGVGSTHRGASRGDWMDNTTAKPSS
jgi:hypothetical protein